MKTSFDRMRGSATGKVLFIGVLVLALLIPMGMIEGLVVERMQRYETVRADVANAWGDSQTVGGPILAVPYEFTRMQYAQPATVRDELYVLPQALEIDGDVEVEELARGIYRVPVYTARLRVTGSFPAPAIDGDFENLEVLWDQAYFALPLADARSIKEPVRLALGGGTVEFQPGGARGVTGVGPQLAARYAELGLGAMETGRAFSFDLVLGGTGTLRFLPLGDMTRVGIRSNWVSPSFGGAYLPEERSVSGSGFTAAWRVLGLGRGYPSTWRRSDPPPSTTASAFGADLIVPIGVHEATLRAAKYAVLVIGLTFVAYFLFELFAALRLHALQYLLIGMATCVFYVLLLALAEQIGFGPAYAASAIASTTLIGTYSAAVLRSMRRAAPVGGLLAALYGYLYVTLEAEDYALLFGALGLFAALAAFMYATRRIDWHTVSFGGGAAPTEPDLAPRVQLHA
jgi:inner membrane protein